MGKCILCKGDIFLSQAEIMCHQVNCQGVMGAGLAKQVRTKYPAVYELYKSVCVAHSADPDSLLGWAMIVETNDSNSKFIANLFAQNGFRKGPSDTQVYTDYNALARAVDEVVKMAEAYGVKAVAVPLNMGCGLAGGDWNVVKDILKSSFQDSPVNLEIWKL